MRIDVHQHLWVEPLLDRLTSRTAGPYLRRERDGSAWRLRIPGEPEYLVDPVDHDPQTRLDRLRDARVDLALVAPPTSFGIESLPLHAAEPLIDAWHDGVADLPVGFAGWAMLPLADPDPARVAAALDAGCIGLCLSATAVAFPDDIDRLSPVLELLEQRDAPLFLHPAPDPEPDPRGERLPGWWMAMNGYVSQMATAWYTMLGYGREAHPRLRIVLPMLAGLAPVHHERLRERGGWVAQPDELVFLDTSSYGPRAIDAVMRVIGLDHIVFGSDHPVVALQPDAYIRGYGTSLLDETAHRMLGGSIEVARSKALASGATTGAASGVGAGSGAGVDSSSGAGAGERVVTRPPTDAGSRGAADGAAPGVDARPPVGGEEGGPRTPVAGAPHAPVAGATGDFDVLEQWERAGVFAQAPSGYQVLGNPERDPWFGLDIGDLVALVERIARDPDMWQRFVSHESDHRTYAQVLRTADVDVWLICWSDDHDTGFHDHDISSGAVHVVEGSVYDERWRFTGEPVQRRYVPGETFDFGPSAIHRMSHAGGPPAVTLHAYSPPLWRVGAYETGADGELVRVVRPYVDELVNGEAAAPA